LIFWLFRDLHGDGQIQGVWMDFTRPIPPDNPACLQNPKALKFVTAQAVPEINGLKNSQLT
jgi:hypothetical protein